MSVDETPAEESEGSSRAAGGCVAVGAVVGALGIVFAVSPEAGTLTVLGAATAAVWWAARRVPKIDKHSPPPPSTPLENTKPQFTVVADPDNPARSHVVWTRKEPA